VTVQAPVHAPARAPIHGKTGLARLREFVLDFTALADRAPNEADLLAEGAALLGALIAEDDWLPASCAAPDPVRYRQYLLHCDRRERFSVVSFVWGPGQATPIHNHAVWGLTGVLRGGELVEGFDRDEEGTLASRGDPVLLRPGEIDRFSPTLGDIHRVANAFDDRVSVSIHVYGADIGRVARSTFDSSGQPKPFVSSYAEALAPDIWGLL
jgi:predicted metal-dependent enzyme (double-stranded beta helix superfamily)